MNIFAILFSLLAFLVGYVLWVDALGNWVSSDLWSVALLALLAVLFVVFLIRVVFFGKEEDRLRRLKIPLIIFALLVGLCLLPLLGHAPFWGRFYLSQSSLDDFASRAMTGPPQEDINKKVGLFRVRRVARGRGWLAFPFSGDAGLLKNGLLVYLPTPQDWTATGFLRSLAGHWYYTLIDDAGLEALLGPEIRAK